MHLMFVPLEMMPLIYYYVCVFCAIYVCKVRLAIMNVLPVCLWNCVFSFTCVLLLYIGTQDLYNWLSYFPANFCYSCCDNLQCACC